MPSTGWSRFAVLGVVVGMLVGAGSLPGCKNGGGGREATGPAARL